MHREFHLSFLVLKASVTRKEFPDPSAVMPRIQPGREGPVTQPEPSSHQIPLQANLSITVYILRGGKLHTLNLCFELWVLVEDFNLFLPIELVFPVGHNLPEMH